MLALAPVFLFMAVALADQKECAAGRLKCCNGGSVAPAHCVKFVARSETAIMACQCPPDFQGINCHIPRSASACPSGQYFDDNPLTTKSKQTFECRIDTITTEALHPLPTSSWAWLRLPSFWGGSATIPDDVKRLAGHSVHLVSDWARGELELLILSRVPVRSGIRIGTQKLGAVEEIVKCNARGCTPDVDTASVTCQSWTCLTPLHNQFPALSAALLTKNSTAIRFGDGTVDIDGFVALDSCMVGTCVPPFAAIGSRAALVLVPAFAVILLLALFGAVVVMHREMQRAPGAIVKRKHGAAITKRKASASPMFAVPIGLAWRDVTYTLPASRSLLCGRALGETIVKEASGMVRAGELVAIIGPSGAGKSTLLDVLAGLKPKGTFTGIARLTGQFSASYPRSHLLSYVPQADHFLGVMTVWETLYFSAVTRLPRVLPESEILERVADTLELVGLAHVATSVVGSPETSGISGGEQRRLALGVELIAEPRVLLLDEITSGLDSFYASSIVGVLRDVATRTGMAIVLTIHQPPAATFALFDRILLMAAGGKSVFQGTPKAAFDFAQQHLLASPATLDGCNPFEYLVTALGSAVLDAAHTEYTQSGAFATIKDEIATLLDNSSSAGGKSETMTTLTVASRQRLTFFQQASVLTMRSFRVVARDPTLLVLYNFLTLVVALVAGCMFMHLDLSVSGIQNRAAYVFCAILIGALLSMTSVDAFVTDRILFEKETRAGCYGVSPYFLAKLAVDLVPFRVVPALIFACVSYHWIGMQHDFAHFAAFAAVLVLSNAVAGASMFAISTTFAEVRSANLVGVAYFMFNIVFGGPLLSQAQRNSSSAVLSLLSFFFYAFETMVSNEMMGLPFFLRISDLVQDDRFGSVGKDATGEEMLNTMSWDPNRRLSNVAVLAAMLGALYAFALVMLKRSQHCSR